MNLGGLATSNRLVYVLIASITILVFLTVVLILRNVGGSRQEVVLQFWGVFDERSAFERTIKNFQALYPNIKVIYTKLTFEDYERNLIDALAADRGPDILMIHNTWLPKHGDKLRPAPESIDGAKQDPIGIKEFRDVFVDVALQDLVVGNRIYALPLYVDTLALYYNKDLLNAAGLTRPPRTWAEFNESAEKMTRFDASGNIIQSGAAIGSSRNINRSTDVLINFMLQSGVQMTDASNLSATFTKSIDNKRVGEVSLQYYTEFTNPSKRTHSWNDSQHYSVDAFSEGTTAMMFNYAHQAPILRAKAPRLNFSVAPMPQFSAENPLTYANYWAPAVSIKSQFSNEAWLFLNYLASREGALDYLTDSRRPAARRDIIDLQRDDLELGVFAQQALTARSWYQADNTAIEGIFADMIDDVNLGRLSVRDALQNAESRVNVLMQRRR